MFTVGAAERGTAAVPRVLVPHKLFYSNV